jgi:hypothetical protein
MMVTIRPFEGGPTPSHSLETARGGASTLLDRGVDRIYLFNFFDNLPYGVTGDKYRRSAPGRAFSQLLRQIGELKTMAGRPRRHILTDPDTRAPGEPTSFALPYDLPVGAKTTFKIPTGPKPLSTQTGQVRLVLQNPETVVPQQWNIRVNGQPCHSLGKIPSPRGVVEPMYSFRVPNNAIGRGVTDVEIENHSATLRRVLWVELALSGAGGKWPSSDVDSAELEPE